MNPVVTVTINPDGRNAKEIDWSVSGCSCFACIRIRERLRTFEIEFVCICDFTNMSGCNIICNPHDLDTSKVYTAEILETYTEPVGNVNGRCRIIS